MPSFSQAVIHRFTNNVSEMKQLMAQDYEDLLQCSIPVFEDLLDEPHNKCVMKLLYWTAEWHALGKLRMHTDTTLEQLRHLTKEFGTLMRQFRDQTCPQFDTVELPREVSTQNRHQQHGQAKVSSKVQSIDGRKGPSSASSHQLVPSPNTTSSLEGATTQMASLSVPSTCKLKTINLLIVKFHFLGDYVQTIQRYGCIDSFSTQLVQHLFLSCQSKC